MLYGGLEAYSMSVYKNCMANYWSKLTNSTDSKLPPILCKIYYKYNNIDDEFHFFSHCERDFLSEIDFEKEMTELSESAKYMS